MISQTIYILTTPRSKERLELLRSRIKPAPVELREVALARPRLVIPWKVRRSYWDQYKKYLDIFGQIVRANQPTLVLEDDALANPGWWDALASLPEAVQDYDFLFLSDDQFNHPKREVTPAWLKCDWSRTTCATVYSPRAAALLLRRRFWCTCAMDWTINHLLRARPDLHSYWHHPGLFQHGSMRGKFASLCGNPSL